MAYRTNFGRPVEYVQQRDYPWSPPRLVKLDTPLDKTK